MSNYSYLIIDFEEFKNALHSLTEMGNTLLEREVNKEEEFAEYKKEKKDWEESIGQLLKTSFAVEHNDFVSEFYGIQQESGFHFGGRSQKPLDTQVKERKDTVRRKIQYLKGNLRIIEQCEYIVEGDKFDIAKKASFKVADKLQLLLEKLYALDDGNYYPVGMLLSGNGVKIKHDNEPLELSKMLENNGYVEPMQMGLGSDDIYIRITTNGSMYLEELDRPYKENYSQIPSDKEIMDERIETIIQELNKQGLGQEVLFNELQELKELFGILNKKNWGQILKGKLFDLALGKLVEKDTINFVYEHLTGHALHLLK
ncbi:hypothetical protein CJD36_009220 [Flavipsychrobacter stenotrophus]|uniref:Uncharacterized protein n=1 Tax=Flavipsychrobacter stenotrophus TaxID=2077091 RepID=A0A2S7SYG7_9BACT|nr:hypothetical protein [Flavipsychrobacter stenotrophus]PQJ11962.1 hypothetical protein CJD36_009220 [Flavipsychrobacter stenotrophus]